jgi:hypothetical protein
LAGGDARPTCTEARPTGFKYRKPKTSPPPQPSPLKGEGDIRKDGGRGAPIEGGNAGWSYGEVPKRSLGGKGRSQAGAWERESKSPLNPRFKGGKRGWRAGTPAPPGRPKRVVAQAGKPVLPKTKETAEGGCLRQEELTPDP